MLKLLLINPSNEHKGLGNIRSTLWPPLNIPYLAAVTPKHYDITLIDENIEPFRFIEADIVGITSYTSSICRGYQIAQEYRNHGIPTIMGGIHVSMLPDEALQYCDAVVIGEAESVWPQVLKDYESKKLKNKYFGSWMDLSNLPLPRRDILQNKYYKWGSIQTSRGCPMNCSFCSVTAFNGQRYRRRPLSSVIDELKLIPQKKILIADDNIIGYGKKDKSWAGNFFSEIIQNQIKKFFFVQSSIQFGEDPELIKLAARAGVRIVFIGMESVNPPTLKSFDKSLNLKRFNQNQYYQLINNIRKEGILVLGAFVLGSDEDDISIFKNTLDFINKSHIDVIQITKPTPLPGTKLWTKINSEQRIINTEFPEAWNDYRFTKMVYKPRLMSIEEVYIGFTYMRSRYYSLESRIKRTLSTFATTKNIYTTLIAYFLNESYRKAFIMSEHYNMYSNQSLYKSFEK